MREKNVASADDITNGTEMTTKKENWTTWSKNKVQTYNNTTT